MRLSRGQRAMRRRVSLMSCAARDVALTLGVRSERLHESDDAPHLGVEHGDAAIGDEVPTSTRKDQRLTLRVVELHCGAERRIGPNGADHGARRNRQADRTRSPH